MKNWNRERQDILYLKKLQNVKSSLPKAQSSPNHPNQKKKQSIPQQSSYQKQHNLKYLLREFGLIQYLRKMYDLGYDDNSLMKLGKLSQKEFEELLFNLKIFPGHQVKMKSMYQYIKQTLIHNSIPTMTKPGPLNSAMRRPLTTNQRKTKSNSANPMKYQCDVKKKSNPMLNSFMKGDFGYEYYCSNTHNSGDNKQKNQIGIGIENINERGVHNDSLEHQKEKIISNKNDKDKDNYDDNDNDDDINTEIDVLLDYYMGQLNEKLDNSYDSIDDSSLSNNRFNEIVNSKEEPKEENNNNQRKPQKEITRNKDEKDIVLENISEIKCNQRDTSISIIEMQKESAIKEPISEKKKENNNKEQLKEVITHKEVKQIDIKEKEDEIIEEYFERKDKEEAEVGQKEERKQQQQAKENNNIDYNNQDLYYNHLSKTEGNKKPNQNQYTDTNSNNLSESNQQTEEDKAYTKEQAIYDNIRLTKSYEGGESLRQTPEQFDIEYMCRCLALAIMKHLESSKDKTHITDLLNQNETFTFFNSLYNSNLSFISSFFDKSKPSPEQISNLDRLDLIDKSDNESITTTAQPPISFMKHITKEGDQLLKGNEKTSKYQHNKEIENNIKFIDEFFSVSKKIRYKNLSERAMTVLNRELSYINEVDSQMSSKLDNSNLTHKKDTTDNILRQSLQQILMNEENTTIKPNQTEPNKSSSNNKFSSNSNKESEEYYTPIVNSNIIQEDINEENQPNEVFESGEMESNYAIDATTVDKLKSYLLKQAEVYDDDYLYSSQRIQTRKYVSPPDPQIIFEFCANIMISTKMEKEVIIVALIYLERLIFNTGLLLTSRNWRRITFTVLVIASKIWDDDSFENNHFAQVFTHLKIGEINLLERIYLELINYKVYVKCSEYFKYFFIIKSIALKYNYNGVNLIPISVEHMMKIQEYAFQMQKKMKKKYSLSNSANF